MSTTEIKSFKLVSGEEIIGEVRGSSPAGYNIESPLLLDWEIHPNGVPAYDLLPWAFSSAPTRQMLLSVFAIASGPMETRSDIKATYRSAVDAITQQNEAREQATRYQKTIFQPRRVSKRRDQ